MHLCRGEEEVEGSQGPRCGHEGLWVTLHKTQIAETAFAVVLSLFLRNGCAAFLSVLVTSTPGGTGRTWIKWQLFGGSKEILSTLVETQHLSLSLGYLQDLALFLHM